jgi:hypothetical protein
MTGTDGLSVDGVGSTGRNRACGTTAGTSPTPYENERLRGDRPPSPHPGVRQTVRTRTSVPAKNARTAVPVTRSFDGSTAINLHGGGSPAQFKAICVYENSAQVITELSCPLTNECRRLINGASPLSRCSNKLLHASAVSLTRRRGHRQRS